MVARALFASGGWQFRTLLLASLLGGGLAGGYFPGVVPYLKPLADIFLNLLLTVIVPLVFFSVSSAVAAASARNTLGKLLLQAGVVFLVMGTLASFWALLAVKFFPPAEGVVVVLANTAEPAALQGFSAGIAGLFTVPEFGALFSHQHMLPLLVFSLLTGLATATREGPRTFGDFLKAGEQVFMKVFSFILYLAPIGFFAWFSVLAAELGPKLAGAYLRIALVCYITCILWFVLFYPFCAWLCGGRHGFLNFWKYISLPMITGFATCSSAAAIPANLAAARAMQIPSDIAETIIPLGTILHKEGSIIGGMFKIAFLFGIFHLDFDGTLVIATAVGISLLVGSVMGAIPGGGMLGELFILSAYGFPGQALVAIAAISILIDPIATMLNVTGNTVSALLVSRGIGDRK